MPAQQGRSTKIQPPLSGGYCYVYAGHLLLSHLPLPELRAARLASSPDIRVALHEGMAPAAEVQWTHDFPDASGRPTLTCQRTDRDYRMQFPGIATLCISDQRNVSIHAHPGAAPESVRHVLLDQGLPRLLALRGELVLHAAVMQTRDGRTLLLIGDSGRGKSTLTGAFLASGRNVANDDGAVVRIEGERVFATPTYPSLRLLPDSRERLFAGVDEDTLPVADYTQKRRLPVPVANADGRVHAIVLLAPPAAENTAPRLTTEPPALACMALIRNGFQLDLSDTGNLKVLLAKAADATRLVPVHQLHYPRRYDVLPAVIDLLEREA